ncbi:M23 family metallopeptidase [Pedococcus bigeumensis]|uniref:M23 family metallopeptidase n=1 Tax=Pedococcus bigeumensis TaxID=433644 RepID=UPI002FEB580C
MRTALLLPVSTAVVVSAGLALPSPQLRSEPARADSSPAVTVVDAVGAAGSDGPRVAPGSATVGTPRPPPTLPGRWSWPLAPRPEVVRPFLRPRTRYGAGHRGIDLAGSTGHAVLAVDAGTVTHVGRIADRGTVTVLHPSGVRSTYEPVEPAVTVGEVVAQGSRLGELAGTGSHCRPTCLHLGAVRDHTYLDPLVFLTGGRRVRLLPLAQAPDG